MSINYKLKRYEITDLSAINNSFESDLKSIAHTWRNLLSFLSCSLKGTSKIKEKVQEEPRPNTPKVVQRKKSKQSA